MRALYCCARTTHLILDLISSSLLAAAAVCLQQQDCTYISLWSQTIESLHRHHSHGLLWWVSDVLVLVSLCGLALLALKHDSLSSFKSILLSVSTPAGRAGGSGEAGTRPDRRPGPKQRGQRGSGQGELRPRGTTAPTGAGVAHHPLLCFTAVVASSDQALKGRF